MADILSQTGINITWTSPLWFTNRSRYGEIARELASYSHTLGANRRFVDAIIGLQLRRDEAEDWFLNGLGRDIIVRNSGGTRIFRGFVDQVDMVAAGVSASIGPLTKVVNRVYCTYNPVFILPSQSTSSGQIEAPAIQDTTSQARYGVWENILNAGSCLVDRATGYNEAARAQAIYLSEFKMPKISWQTSGNGGIELRLTIRGYYDFFGAYLYQNRPLSPATITFSAMITAVVNANVNPSVISTDLSGIATNAALVINKAGDYKIASSVIESVLAGGDGAGNLWTLGIDPDNRVIYKQADISPYYLFSVLDNHQQLSLIKDGSLVAPWDIQAGRVCYLSDWITSISGPPRALGSDIRVAMIDQVRYDAPYSFTIATQEINKFDLLMNNKGLGGF